MNISIIWIGVSTKGLKGSMIEFREVFHNFIPDCGKTCGKSVN